MAQVLATVVAQQLDAVAAIGVQRIVFYLVAQVQPKGRKAAAGIKLFRRLKQEDAALTTNVMPTRGLSGSKVNLLREHHAAIKCLC